MCELLSVISTDTAASGSLATFSKIVQTEISMEHLDMFVKKTPQDVGALKRKFITDDVMRSDQTCRFYTGSLHVFQ